MRILIADDHPLVAGALAGCIHTIDSTAKITQSTEFEDAMERASSESPDLILLDYRMPGVQGLQGLRLMRGRFPNTRIAMISGIADGQQMLEAIQLGADGFIPKDLSLPALKKALELILIGETFIPAKLFHSTGLAEEGVTFDWAAATHAGERLSGLTPREVEVLVLVEQGLTNRRVADAIGTKEVTVAFHLKNAFKKLGVKNRTEAAAQVRKLGLGKRAPS